MLKATAQESLVDAAIETLRTEGFVGSSARAIARRAGVNQALVFYYFGSVHALLLAALDETSTRRMHAYESLIDSDLSIERLLARAQELHREDLETGHVTVLAEMIAGSLAHPQLKTELRRRVQPWNELVERALERVLGESPIGAILPVTEIARAVVAFYIGIDLLGQLDSKPSETNGIFATFGTLIGPLLVGAGE